VQKGEYKEIEASPKGGV